MMLWNSAFLLSEQPFALQVASNDLTFAPTAFLEVLYLLQQVVRYTATLQLIFTEHL